MTRPPYVSDERASAFERKLTRFLRKALSFANCSFTCGLSDAYARPSALVCCMVGSSAKAMEFVKRVARSEMSVVASWTRASLGLSVDFEMLAWVQP